MSKRNRKWKPGSIMHLINRGNEKQDIFKDGYDYEVFRSLIADAAQESDYEILAMCAMPNHFHIMAKTTEFPLGEWMKKIQVAYAKYFNDRYGRIGHLFGSRYASTVVDSNPYLLQLSSYIHLNPVASGIVSRPEDYQFSSYRTYIGLANDPLFQTRAVLQYFDPKDPAAGYKEFIESNMIKHSLAEATRIARAMAAASAAFTAPNTTGTSLSASSTGTCSSVSGASASASGA